MGINNYLLIKCAAGKNNAQKQKKINIGNFDAIGAPPEGYALNANPAQVFDDALELTGAPQEPPHTPFDWIRHPIQTTKEVTRRAVTGAGGRMRDYSKGSNFSGVVTAEGVPAIIEDTAAEPTNVRDVQGRAHLRLPVNSANNKINNNTIRSSDRALLYGLTGAGIGGLSGLGVGTIAANALGLKKNEKGEWTTPKLYGRRALQILSALGLGTGGYYLGSAIGGKPIALKTGDPRMVTTEMTDAVPVRISDLLTPSSINSYNNAIK